MKKILIAIQQSIGTAEAVNIAPGAEAQKYECHRKGLSGCRRVWVFMNEDNS